MQKPNLSVSFRPFTPKEEEVDESFGLLRSIRRALTPDETLLRESAPSEAAFLLSSKYSHLSSREKAGVMNKVGELYFGHTWESYRDKIKTRYFMLDTGETNFLDPLPSIKSLEQNDEAAKYHGYPVPNTNLDGRNEEFCVLVDEYHKYICRDILESLAISYERKFDDEAEVVFESEEENHLLNKRSVVVRYGFPDVSSMREVGEELAKVMALFGVAAEFSCIKRLDKKLHKVWNELSKIKNEYGDWRATIAHDEDKTSCRFFKKDSETGIEALLDELQRSAESNGSSLPCGDNYHAS